MNLDKYGDTNCSLIGDYLDRHTVSAYKIYLRYIKSFRSDITILEIGPGNGSFLVFLQNHFHLNSDNIHTIDISKTVHQNLLKHQLTKDFQHAIGDVKDILSQDEQKYDLIIMRHVLEHMKKEYISELIPVLTNSLNPGGQMLIEVPNVANFPFGYTMYWGDFSHHTAFNDKSLEEAFIWHSDNLDIKVHNLFLYTLDYRNPWKFLVSVVFKIVYAGYIYGTLLLIKVIGLPIRVFTASILAIVEKK